MSTQPDPTLIENTIKDSKLLGYKYNETEIVIGIVSAVGTETQIVIDHLTRKLVHHSYNVEVISVSKQIINKILDTKYIFSSEVERINYYMGLGNNIRERAADFSILSLCVAAEIYKNRQKDENNLPTPNTRRAYIINSLKHPDEVERLREIYTNGFYLIGISQDEERRKQVLLSDKKSTPKEAEELIARDQNESDKFGQQTRDTFQLSDFFINIDENQYRLKGDIERIVDLIFSCPFITPTFDEYAMFMAFTSSLRSADLSRQVGAVIARDNEIIATGANDCPKSKGGLHWPIINTRTGKTEDEIGGRDHTLGYDSNKKEQQEIIDNILKSLPDSINKEDVKNALTKSKLSEITEYGRIVHAEMETLMFCARNNISARNATLFCTTFPCHNCAKHIIASGIEKVTYIEPYPKSKAFIFYANSITNDPSDHSKVCFTPFVGVGPRRFFDLFSMQLSSGHPIRRKGEDGKVVDYDPSTSKVRLQMLPWSYLEKEEFASLLFESFLDRLRTETQKTQDEEEQ